MTDQLEGGAEAIQNHHTIKTPEIPGTIQVSLEELRGIYGYASMIGAHPMTVPEAKNNLRQIANRLKDLLGDRAE